MGAPVPRVLRQFVLFPGGGSLLCLLELRRGLFPTVPPWCLQNVKSRVSLSLIGLAAVVYVKGLPILSLDKRYNPVLYSLRVMSSFLGWSPMY